ncbi:hypothetical protein BA059_04915 [Mycolicibacterium sp. (ex Dasyatis americana)]|uniref:hypothetical protein n=1 Tax=Mycobacterium sp. DBP42 TaxID=2545267 RepID=UPI000873197D|nr:hypothetical protein [Mycobacterium sp. DBP42]OFB42557.1 hypothetical protein BA059_04915 [Mycolicibacterium sp. (ex Dasyatis americana)]TMS50369.1 hypothetical protein E0T84_23920 [Mycobacterium sp. DBP42]
MIIDRKPDCTIAADLFRYAHQVVWESGVAELIDDQYQLRAGEGGRPTTGVAYSTTAVLVALLVRVLMTRPPTLTGIVQTIAEFRPAQLAAVGMAGHNSTTNWQEHRTEYKRFTSWWARRLTAFDSWADLPARRMTNAEYRTRLDKRTEEQREHARQAARLLHLAINRLVAASVEDANPEHCRGDLVVDGTLYSVAKQDGTIGSAADKLRGAVLGANFHVRDKKSVGRNGESTTRQITYAAMSMEMTALTRIGKPSAMHAVAPVFVGIAIHYATSGSPQGMAEALEQAEANGLTGRPPGPRARWPFMTFDMAYNSKDGCADILLKHRYSPVGRFPDKWGIECPSTTPAWSPTTDTDPGVLQWAGAFYCPAVLSKIRGHRTPKMEHLLDNDKFRAHDKRLRRILPYLMGYNSRPFYAPDGYGRPRLGRIRKQVVKMKFVCPAAMGTVKCPLKPESMRHNPVGVPLAEPTWQAHERACCANASVMITLTPEQFKRAQWDLVPGSWEHSLYFEAARALTEQRFSHLKSAHVTGLNQLNYGPRRDPMIKLILAMAAVASNRHSQMNFDPLKLRAESIDIRMRQLADDLGHEPARTPPRT